MKDNSVTIMSKLFFYNILRWELSVSSPKTENVNLHVGDCSQDNNNIFIIHQGLLLLQYNLVNQNRAGPGEKNKTFYLKDIQIKSPAHYGNSTPIHSSSVYNIYQYFENL